MYCADGAAKELSDGEYSSVADYLDKTLDYDLGYIKAYHYCNTYPTTESKETIANMGSEIISTFRTRIENSSWLSGATIAAAIDKLDNMGMNYGEPIEWPYTESLEFDTEILVDNILTIKTLRNKVIGSILGKHYADYVSIIAMYSDTQPLFPFSVNAFYMPSVNAFNILPSLMMEPAYNANAEEAELYATLGFTIGHEITHGYDKGGSTYDKYGNVSNWWTDEDLAKFTALNERRIANVATFEVIPGYLAKAEATVREDVADLGGFAITYNLWCDILEERGLQGEELNEQKRAFFLKYASLFFEKHPESYMIKRLKDDTHSAGHIRINSVVQHIDDWYELFDVKEGDALYLAPEDRIVIW
jgi:putative endopeptidase